MVIFDYTFGQRKAKSPATLFGGKPGLENGFELRFMHPFPGIAYINIYRAVFLLYIYGNGSVVIDGIDGIFAQVFNHPRKECCIQRGNNNIVIFK